MARSFFIFVIIFLFIFCYTPVRSNDKEGHITVDISNKGLDFLKDLLIEKAESSMLPLYLPKIEKAVKIPVVGKVHMVLSNITVERIDVMSSNVKTGDNGMHIAVSGATANLSMNWKYSYSTWLVPIAVSDQGSATIGVESIKIGLTLSLKNLHGSLKLSVLECGCNVKDISIKLDGGSSWLYQGLVDAFEGKIISAVKNAVSKKINDGIIKLDSLLQSLPKEVPITNIAALNFTFVDDPKLSESSLDLEIDGLLSAKDEIMVSNHYQKTLQPSFSCKEVDKMVKIVSAVENAVSKKIHDGIIKLDSLFQFLPKEVPITNIAALNFTFVDDPKLSESSLDLEIDGLLSAKDEIMVSNHYHKTLQPSFSCKEVDKMVRVSMHEDVLKSALTVYFEAKRMHWIIDNVSDQYLLNTAGWRFIVPQLYKLYPDDDINLNISVSSLPTIKFGKQQIDATIPLDMVIDVSDAGEIIPVAGISMVISASIFAEISGSTVFGSVKLNDFSMSLKWSKIGDLHMRLVQSVISTVLKTVILPYVNVQLSRGHSLPMFHGYKLQDPQIVCVDSWIVFCSDVASAKRFSIG